MCLHVCPLYHPSSFEIAQRPPRQFMNVNERGYKHLCNSAYVCVQSINPSLKIPPSPLLPPHPGGCFVVPPHFSPCSHLPLPWQQTLLCFFFFCLTGQGLKCHFWAVVDPPLTSTYVLFATTRQSMDLRKEEWHMHTRTVHSHTGPWTLYDVNRLFFTSSKLYSFCFVRILRHNSQPKLLSRITSLSESGFRVSL